jgi:ABC-type uncharacterized transport system auxiliary subunit
MFTRQLLGTVAWVLLASGCSSVISKPAPSSLYLLHYAPQMLECHQGTAQTVRVWPLEAAAPYDQEAMVVLSNATKVEYSAQHRWVAQPGQLVANWLIRDLSQDRLFAEVLGFSEPVTAHWGLGGRLFAFAWKRLGDRSQAILDLEMTLMENPPGLQRNILFRKHYQLASEPTSNSSAEGFAQAMSALAREFSAQLRNDLCAVLAGNQSSKSAWK